MEYVDDGVRTRLIIAGINELENHGIKDFSLRRAALGAQVSCAAPYRHFKDKDEFIIEIIRYIVSKWELFCREIIAVFASDKKRLVVELAIASVRFWLANPNFRSVLTIGHGAVDMSSLLSAFDNALLSAVADLQEEKGEGANIAMKQYTVRAIVYGTVMLVGRGDIENNAETLDKLRKKLEEEFY